MTIKNGYRWTKSVMVLPHIISVKKVMTYFDVPVVCFDDTGAEGIFGASKIL
jgi:hypothetical protein